MFRSYVLALLFLFILMVWLFSPLPNSDNAALSIFANQTLVGSDTNVQLTIDLRNINDYSFIRVDRSFELLVGLAFFDEFKGIEKVSEVGWRTAPNYHRLWAGNSISVNVNVISDRNSTDPYQWVIFMNEPGIHIFHVEYKGITSNNIAFEVLD